MQVTVNGHLREIRAGTSITELLQLLDLDPRFLAVERNRQLVPRKEHPDCRLEPGDEIEIVTLVGGG